MATPTLVGYTLGASTVPAGPNVPADGAVYVMYSDGTVVPSKSGMPQNAVFPTQVGAVAYRSGITAADGTTKPAANSALFLLNPGGRAKARVFVSATGTTPTAGIRPYFRNGGTGGQVGTSALQTLNGTPNFDLCFDVQVDGDDLALLVETIGGTTPSVSIWVSWR